MGTWGTAINSSDLALDVIDDCKVIYPVLPPDEANNLILDIYKETLSDESDSEYTEFWYALCNWQWDHGVLPEKNKRIALELLSKKQGIEPWIEEGNIRNIKKRSEVLEKLSEKLDSQQPPEKLPKLRLKKPKHKKGDIIIFKATDESFDDGVIWQISMLSSSKYYKSINQPIPEELSPPFDASGCYMAILCVGESKEPYSKHFPNLFNRNSVYAFYDYCHKEKPTAEILSQCGFLPNYVIDYEDFNRRIIRNVEWTFTFETIDTFRAKKGYIESIEKHHQPTEADRFTKLLKKKGYKGDTVGMFWLIEAFEAFFEEKLRLSSLTPPIPIDTLINDSIINPTLEV